MAKRKGWSVSAEPVIEAPVEAPVVEAPPPPKKVDFAVWFAMREKRIPAHHLREILLADFKGRGLSSKETVEAYDAALAAYGVRLE